jgi:RHS repeat-associated protein
VEALDPFGHAGGRVRYYESGDQLAYQYGFSDHLGNTRVLAEPDGQGVVQETSYYPYGLQIADLGGGSSTNEELYNGKELTDSHGLNWYHYGARYYDLSVARWTTMDPADEFHSPYVYVGGDPVNFVDPDGMTSQSPEDISYIDTDGSARVERAEGPNEYHLRTEDGGYRQLDLTASIDQLDFVHALSKNSALQEDIWMSESQNIGYETPGIGSLVTRAGAKEAWNLPVTEAVKFAAVQFVGATAFSVGQRLYTATRALNAGSTYVRTAAKTTPWLESPSRLYRSAVENTKKAIDWSMGRIIRPSRGSTILRTPKNRPPNVHQRPWKSTDQP